jgi:hypothetical protein
MTQWLILKTDPAKEFAVASALSALGHEVWVPTYVATAYERFTAGPGVSLRRKKPIERPLMPSVILSVHTPPPRYLAAVNHLKGIWRDCLDLPVLIPEIQVSQFRERVDAVNTAEITRIMKAQMGKRKSKRVLKIDPNLADELKLMLFGQREQEAA